MDHPFVNNPYAPPIGRPMRPANTITPPLEMLCVATTTGLVLGIVDVYQSNLPFLLFRVFLYACVSLFLGWRHGISALWAVHLLGSSLYPIHLAAIAKGFKRPYVERGEAEAIVTLVLNVPCLMGFSIGVVFHRMMLALSDSASGGRVP